MKFTKSYLLIAIFLICCNNTETTNSNDFVIKTTMLCNDTTFKVELVNSNFGDSLFLNMKYYTDSIHFLNYKVVSFKKINDKFVCEIQIPKHTYYAYFAITNSKDYLSEFKILQFPISEKNGIFSEKAYYYLLYYSEKEKYIKIFDECRKLYPDKLGIYLIRWMYEGSNKLNKLDSLNNQIAYLEKNYSNNHDLSLLQLVAAKLRNDTNTFNKMLEFVSTRKYDILNDELIYLVVSRIIDISVKDKFNNTKKITQIRNFINNNINSYFAIRLSMNPFIGRNDSNTIFNIDMYNRILEFENYYYYDILLNKYMYLVWNSPIDSIEVLNRIGKELENVIKNKQEFYVNGKSDMTRGVNPQIYNEIKYWKCYNTNDFRGAINTSLDYIKEHPDEVELNYGNYVRVSDIFKDKLFNIDSSLFYTIQNYNIQTGDKKKILTKTLNSIKNDFYSGSLEFNLWIDSLKMSYKRKSVRVDNEVLPILNTGSEKIDLNNLNKNCILFFTTNNCTFCRDVINDTKKNISLLSKNNIELICLSNEVLKDKKNIEESLKLKYPVIIADPSILNFFKVNAYPVLYYLDKKGKIINIQIGASSSWRLEEAISVFDL